jgi:hypothetical protein
VHKFRRVESRFSSAVHEFSWKGCEIRVIATGFSDRRTLFRRVKGRFRRIVNSVLGHHDRVTESLGREPMRSGVR